MKKLNLLVMSLVSAAALSFTSCSSNDDLTGNAGQDKVDGVYMTLSIQTPKSESTRTSEDNRETEKATDEECALSNGTIYLYDGNKLIYSKAITSADWLHLPNRANNGRGTTNPIKISANGIEKGKTYNVYFLAGDKTTNSPLTAEQAGTYTIDDADPTKISLDLATANKFVMFNQNDAQRQNGGDKATVKFAGDETADDPAYCQMIYLDRVAARVDAPNAKSATLQKGEGENAPATKNLDLVKSIDYQNYAISNLSNNTNIMQKWESNFAKFLVPTVTYTQDYNTFGDKWNNNGSIKFFGNQANYYILENSTDNDLNATTIYLSYKATLNNTEGADFNDGTFYRYDYKIYTSLQQIMDDPTVEWPFREADGSIMTVENAKKLFIDENGALKDQAALASVREQYGLDIYEQGKMYYRVALVDEAYKAVPYSILRNTVYRLNVKNIYDLGRDVPNGPTPDDKDKNYYLTCDVTVNPWVLSNQDVDLK